MTTADRILDAAETLFSQYGFAGASVRDIADKVEITPASLYNHFPGKLELYEAVIARGLAPLRDAIQEFNLVENSTEHALSIVDSLVDEVGRRPAVARILQFEALTGGDTLAKVTGQWLVPMYAAAAEVLQQSEAGQRWESAELPLLLAAFQNMIFGHFATAAMLNNLVNEDLFSPEALERQKRFMKKVAVRLVTGDG